MNDFIEAEYTVENDDDKNNNKEIKINTDPLCSLIDNITDVFKEQIRCNNEFKMYKEKERTERERIRAQLEICKDMLNKRHEQIMNIIKSNYSSLNKLMDYTQKNVEEAIKENNFELVKYLMDYQMNFMNKVNSTSLQALSNGESKGFTKMIGNDLATKSLE